MVIPGIQHDVRVKKEEIVVQVAILGGKIDERRQFVPTTGSTITPAYMICSDFILALFTSFRTLYL